ncbi:MAG: NfeD family protein [Ilumatobacteraceae bacterium]|nr:NfeD family protein [Ilumatobacteraceae bacterium]
MLSDALDLGIDLDLWPWVWLGTAVVFALVELIVVGGSFIILPWAASAFLTAILAFYDVSIEVQWAVFVFGGAVFFAIMYRWAQRFMKEHTMDPGVGADRLVGLTAIVTTPIEPDDTTRAGRVTVDGEVWGAITNGAYRIADGARVRVLAMKGTRVVVEPLAPEHRPSQPAPGGEE